MPARLARTGVLAGLALAGGMLLAAQLAFGVVVDDAKDAPGSQLDLRRVSAVQSQAKGSDKIRQQIRYHGSTANAQGMVCLGIYKSRTANTPTRTACFDYEGLSKPETNDTLDPDFRKCPPLRNDDFEEPTACKGKSTGEADIRYGRTGVILTYRPKAIGSPDSFYFGVKSRAFVEQGPPPGQFCCTDTTGRKKLALK
jgi:hypothetical protein